MPSVGRNDNVTDGSTYSDHVLKIGLKEIRHMRIGQCMVRLTMISVRGAWTLDVALYRVKKGSVVHTREARDGLPIMPGPEMTIRVVGHEARSSAYLDV
jgi:hypothetical protein